MPFTINFSQHACNSVSKEEAYSSWEIMSSNFDTQVLRFKKSLQINYLYCSNHQSLCRALTSKRHPLLCLSARQISVWQKFAPFPFPVLILSHALYLQYTYSSIHKYIMEYNSTNIHMLIVLRQGRQCRLPRHFLLFERACIFFFPNKSGRKLLGLRMST